MDPQAGSPGGRAPPSSKNQIQLQGPRPPSPLTVGNQSHIIKKPQLPPRPAAVAQNQRGSFTGGRTPPSSRNQVQLQEPRPPSPLSVGNQSHIIKKPQLPPRPAAVAQNPRGSFTGGRTPPSSRNQVQLQEPRPPSPLGASNQSHIIKKPPLPPRPNAAGESQQWKPIKIYYEGPRKLINCSVSDFPALVQRLTGKPPDNTETSGSGCEDVSPAAKLASIEKTSPTKKERKHKTGGDAMTELEEVEVGQVPGILSPTPTTLAQIAPDFFSPVPERSQFMDGLSPSCSETSFIGSSSGLQPAGTVSPPAILSSTSSTLAPVAPEFFSPVQETVPFLHDLSRSWSETSFTGNPSGMQSTDAVSPSEILSSTSSNLAPISPVQETVPYVHDLCQSWSENSFTGIPSVLPSVSMVSTPATLSPASPTLAPLPPDFFSPFPEPLSFVHDVGPFRSQNSFTGSSSGLQAGSIVSSLGTLSSAPPTFSPIAPDYFSPLPEPLSGPRSFVHDLSPFGSNTRFTGSPWGSQSTSPLGTLSSAMPTFTPTVPDFFSVLQDIRSPWSKNSFTGSSSGLHSASIVMPPVTLSPVSSAPDFFSASTGTLPVVQDFRSPWSKTSFTGSPSGSHSESIVMPPVTLTPPPVQDYLSASTPTLPVVQDFCWPWSKNSFTESSSGSHSASVVMPPALETLTPASISPDCLSPEEEVVQASSPFRWEDSLRGNMASPPTSPVGCNPFDSEFW